MCISHRKKRNWSLFILHLISLCLFRVILFTSQRTTSNQTFYNCKTMYWMFAALNSDIFVNAQNMVKSNTLWTKRVSNTWYFSWKYANFIWEYMINTNRKVYGRWTTLFNGITYLNIELKRMKPPEREKKFPFNRVNIFQNEGGLMGIQNKSIHSRFLSMI